MSRAKLLKSQQKEFLRRVSGYFGGDWSEVAKISNISTRTLNDWRRERYNIRYESLLKLQRISNIPLPKIIRILPEFWSARKFGRLGALRRNQMYGNPGTPEGRRRGGINSQVKFRLNPEYARKLGVNVRNDIRKPKQSEELAEFMGIMLGDGGISTHQINITLNEKTDKEYCIYVRKLIKRLFSVSTSLSRSQNDNAVRIVVSAVNLVELLCEKGLKKGNKVRNQVGIPPWIIENKRYGIACLRGLMDTDGSFYSYRHKVNNKTYRNSAICFTNVSKPLLSGAFKILVNLGLTPSLARNRVYLYKKEQVDKYFSIVGSHNPKHLNKYKIARLPAA